MTPNGHFTFLAAALIPLTMIVSAGCGGDDNAATASSGPPTTASDQAATLGVSSNSDLGDVLVDSNGRTLYLFEKDSGTTSACTAGCASVWPPLQADGNPMVGSGATAAQIGTTKRSDGAPQITYNGHPLYTFTGDQSPGDVNGQGLTNFGGLWYAVSPAGDAVTDASTSNAGFSY
jgi:predicted lipoprotein with Yx(FWY)xxD motif